MEMQFEIQKTHDILIRITANKREVGILKESIDSKELKPISKFNAKNCAKNTNDSKKCCSTSLKFKCFKKYKDFNKNQNTLGADRDSNADVNNNNNVSMIKRHRVFNLDISEKKLNIRERLQRLKRGIESLTGKIVIREHTVSPSKNKSKSNSTANSTQGKCLEKRKSSKKVDSKQPLIQSCLKRSYKDINDNSSDEESGKKHPNRRLELERSTSEMPTKRYRWDIKGEESSELGSDYRLRSIVVPIDDKQSQSESSQKRPRPIKLKRGNGEQKLPKEETDVNPLKDEKEGKIKEEVKSREGEDEQTQKIKNNTSIIWKNLITSKKLWLGEPVYSLSTSEVCDNDSEDQREVDYDSLLGDFIEQAMAGIEHCRGETPYEKRVDEMMKDAKCEEMWKEFYISPALVEVFHHETENYDSAQESLAKICELKKWPEPTFASKHSRRGGFRCSCTLKSKTFAPGKPASNEELAKELAALECLEWLGLQPRPRRPGGTYLS